MPAAPTPAPSAPWWPHALSAFGDHARRWLRERFPTLLAQHEDIVGDATVQLTRMLQAAGADYPQGWYGGERPSDGDVKRFHGLAHTVLERRVQDAFRLHYRDWMQSLEDLPPERLPADPAPDAETRLSQQRAVRALLLALQGLSARDQWLVQRVGLGEHDPPLSGAERERLRQIRIQLRRQLRDELQGLIASRRPG